MKLMIDLFSTDYGLMSLIVILLILVMAVFFTRLAAYRPMAMEISQYRMTKERSIGESSWAQ